MAIEPYFQSKETCPVCKMEFPVIKVRERLVKIKQDSDFCSHYQEINPYYYSIYVCPQCGFAVADSHLNEINNKREAKILSYMLEHPLKVDLTGIRTLNQAIASYRLALQYAEVMEFKASQFAGLYLKFAWLFRESNNIEEEKKYLRKACDNWIKAASTEHFPIGAMSQSKVEYLIGDLCRRLGDFDLASQYTYGVMHMDPIELEILRLARENYQLIREEKSAMQKQNGVSENGILKKEKTESLVIKNNIENAEEKKIFETENIDIDIIDTEQEEIVKKEELFQEEKINKENIIEQENITVKEGSLKGVDEIICNMLNDGIPIESVVKWTGLTIFGVQKLVVDSQGKEYAVLI